MSPADLLREVVRALNDAGIPHMVVGSFASTSYGAPRATHDIDTILAKLEWAAMGGSDRQVVDAATVLRVGAGGFDDEYLHRWAAELGVSDLQARARG